MKRVCAKSALIACLVVLAGCTSQTSDTDVDGGPKDARPLMTPEAVASVRDAVEKCGGTIRLDEHAQPVGIDLAVGRGSTDAAAFEAAIRCTQLKSFRARAGQIATEDLRKLAVFTSLEELLLQDAALDDDVLADLVGAMKGLRRLTLRNTPKVSDVGIGSLVDLSQLERLALINLQITDQAVPTFAKLPALVSLDLRQCTSLGGSELGELKAATLLRELKLSDIDDATLEIVASFPHLESLTVEDSSLTAEGIAKLALNVPTANRLRSLSFARCLSLDDEALAPLASFGSLRRLSLRDVSVTGTCLANLSTLGEIELLSLNELFLSDEAFEAIGRCRQLKRLELSQGLLTPEAIETIASLSNLEYLDVTSCDLDDEKLQPLHKLNNLRTLIVEGNPGVSQETVVRLTQPSN